ncbi:MAG: hypothetical protein IPK16_16025 [Anaerolineales bacterium]|nr:hypothetical protein [Anaerolineales bacterium]
MVDRQPRCNPRTMSGWWALAALFACAVLFLWATPVHAKAQIPDQPLTEEEEKACSCHSEEKTMWEQSPHGGVGVDGQPIAACATCHGDYVRGHPDEGMIPLDTDSSVCIDCHETTADQWQGTVHADAGIQCISCHASHSQDLRLADRQLCESCHRESLTDSLHTAHWLGDTPCISCHLAESAAPAGIASTDLTAVFAAERSHDFTSVSATRCLSCHTSEVTSISGNGQQVAVRQQALFKAAEAVPVLQSELAVAQDRNVALLWMNPMLLGVGISIGGVLGIVFMLAAARFSKPKGG